MCDPHRRGKLTKHGWRVAYHLARCAKTRKLELPETLPQCLYPPGSDAGASRQTDGGGAGPENSGKQSRPVGSEKGVAKGSAVVAESAGDDNATGDAIVTATGEAKEKKAGKGNNAKIYTRKGILAAKGAGGSPAARGNDDPLGEGNSAHVGPGDTVISESRHGGDNKNKTLGGKQEDRRTKMSDTAVSTKKIETPASPTKSDKTAYQMNQKEKARYDKAFDKLVKGASGKNLGRKKAGSKLCIRRTELSSRSVSFRNRSTIDGYVRRGVKCCALRPERDMFYVPRPRDLQVVRPLIPTPPILPINLQW